MKKVLVITYYWPPSGGPGVQRVLKFCKYLPEFGWEPIVLTTEEGEYPAIDYSFDGDVPPECMVYRTRTFEPFSLYKKFTGQSKIPTYQLGRGENESWFSRVSKWTRMNIFLPDPRIGWYPFALKKAKSILKNHNVDVIFSSSPPQSVHLIARTISFKGIPWVADFRDPWKAPFYSEGQKRNLISDIWDRRLERKTLSSITRITTVSPGYRTLLGTKISQDKIYVIYNGFDEPDFQVEVDNKRGDEIIISYIGTMSESRKPLVLFQALNKLLKENTKTSYQLNIVGDTHPSVIRDLKNYEILRKSKLFGYISHTEALTIMRQSHFLVVVVPKTENNNGIVPAKLFEYIRSKFPIILIGPPDGDAASIIRKTHSGFVFDYDDVDSIKKILTSNPTIQPKDYQVFNRRNLTKQLVAIFNTIT
ncbi:MAG: glycosyltransferase family 4 protein [Nitrosopumilus sp.]